MFTDFKINTSDCWLPSPDCSGNPFFRPNRFQKPVRSKKRLQRKAGLASKNHSNLILYFLMLTIMNKKVIAIKIRVSFQITANVAPFSIIALMMIMNHFAGIILLITCNGNGILEMGKMNPDNKITGNISPKREIIIAVCCESEMVEIKIPSAKAQIMNKTVSKASKTRLPSMGISNIK